MTPDFRRPTRRGFLGAVAAVATAIAVGPATIIRRPAPLVVPPPLPPAMPLPAGRYERLPFNVVSGDVRREGYIARAGWHRRLVPSRRSRALRDQVGSSSLSMGKGTSGRVTLATPGIPWANATMHGLESSLVARGPGVDERIQLAGLRMEGGASLFAGAHNPLSYYSDDGPRVGLRSYPRMQGACANVEIHWFDLPEDTVAVLSALVVI